MKPGKIQHLSSLASGLVLAAFVAWLSPAQGMAAEVYTWTDENGTIHFSDTLPQSAEAQTMVLQQDARPATANAVSPPAEAGEAANAEPGETAVSAAQQRRNKMAEDRTKRQQEQAWNDEMCGKHRKRLEQMEPARRVYYVDESGEEVRMDDDQRIELIDESKAFLSENCQ